MSIHPLAQISGKAKLGEGNTIGPFTVIEEGVEIGSGNSIGPSAMICRGTTLGDANEIHLGAVIGNTPQDLAYKGAPTFTRIGSHNIIREYVTIHRGTKEGTATVIGDHNFLMANVHVAHNCSIANHVILVNLASLTGYCTVEEGAFLSGMTGLHQFCRVGRYAIVSALSVSNKDIPPYAIVGGRPAAVQGVNVIGLRRAGFSAQARTEIRRAFKILFEPGVNMDHAVKRVETAKPSKEVRYLLDFIRSSKRGVCPPQGQVIDTILSKRRKRAPQASDTDAEEALEIL